MHELDGACSDASVVRWLQGSSFAIGDFIIRAGPLSLNELLKAHLVEVASPNLLLALTRSCVVQIEYCPCSSVQSIELEVFEQIAQLLSPSAKLCCGSAFSR